MLLEGVNLMVVGMTTVFSFLVLLVVVLLFSARVFEVYGDRWPDPVSAPDPLPDATGGLAGAEIAVVLAAVEAYRRQQG
ncbi:MAG: OadG family transporter subunit [Acidobacteriota bacterium]|nr:OadG family transporter subunit [Acidobacteriota bacterium]